jgi:LPS export ABC transporter protein LptC
MDLNRKIFTFSLLLILTFVLSCGNVEEQHPTDKGKLQNLPDQESWDSKITMTHEGERMAEVWAGYIAVYDDSDLAVLKDSIHVDFFDKEGKHNSVLTADSGIVHFKNENLEAMGNVKVVSDSGIVLETQKLNWDNQKQKVISDVPVKFTTPEDTLLGDSFISDPDLKNYEIRNARGYSRRKIPLKK